MFILLKTDGNARLGRLKTSHGWIETPFFMPVATKGATKNLSFDDLQETGTQAIISNAFLLSLKPGLETIKKFNGLHKFINWNKIIFTDSGGFQILSPNFIIKIEDAGATFRSPFNGGKIFLSPEKAIQIQNSLGSDVAMCLDDVPHMHKTRHQIEESVKRTTHWAKRCLDAHKNKKQLLFCINQGGTHNDLREKSILSLLEFKFDGMALGGLSIGEEKTHMLETISYCNKLIPERMPRYLMGVGSPIELLESIERGIDIFDSCFLTRMGRHGQVFSSNGRFDLSNAKFSKDKTPLDKDCKCFVCRQFSKAYLHHLLRTSEPTVLHYISFHNVFFVQNLIKNAKTAIKENSFEKFKKSFVKKYKN